MQTLNNFIRGIIVTFAISLFLLVILSLGAIGFLVFMMIMLGVFIFQLNKKL